MKTHLVRGNRAFKGLFNSTKHRFIRTHETGAAFNAIGAKLYVTRNTLITCLFFPFCSRLNYLLTTLRIGLLVPPCSKVLVQ